MTKFERKRKISTHFGIATRPFSDPRRGKFNLGGILLERTSSMQTAATTAVGANVAAQVTCEGRSREGRKLECKLPAVWVYEGENELHYYCHACASDKKRWTDCVSFLPIDPKTGNFCAISKCAAMATCRVRAKLRNTNITYDTLCCYPCASITIDGMDRLVYHLTIVTEK